MVDEQIRDAIKSIAEQEYDLKVQIAGVDTNGVGVIILTPKELLSTISHPLKMNVDDFSLTMIALTTRLMLPVKVDEVTTWVETCMTNNTFEYVYNIDDVNIDMLLVDAKQMKKEKMMMLSQNLSIMQNVIEKCVSSHRNLIYRYVGTRTKKSIDIVFSENELRKIVNRDEN